MASTQEQRIQLKRIATATAGAADKWSTREQLCLASAVAYSGDQNWMSVSRSLKLLCGTNRPADWFSQKSCAVQYGELLENVETPKRKKRSISGDIGGAGSSSSGGAPNTETPTESILRKLTQERISELRALIQREQEEFVKLREEILYVQSSLPTETELREMLAQIEMEKEQKLLEQQKYVQWIKEREELQKCSWRPGTSQQAQQQQPIPSTSAAAQLQQQQQSQQGKPNLQLNLNVKSEDMETEDSNSNTKAGTGTSPLLTSLLKSPSPAPVAASSSSSGSSSSTSITQISSNLRATAPTITNLLTGGNAQIQQQITTAPSTSTLSSPYNNSVHNQPLTGPIPVHPQFQQTIPTTPSKSAPTLSMLLENKNKENLSATVTSATTVIIDSSASSNSITTKDETMNAQQQEAMEEGQDGDDNKDEDQQLMEVFKGLLPDNIEELADILTNNNAIILNPELLEEESILENVESLIDDEQEVDDEVIAENKDLKNDVIVNNQQKPEKSTETNVEKKISLTTTIENKQNPKDVRDMENISDFSKESKAENDLKVDKNKNDGIDDHGNLNISKIKEEIKMEIDQEEEIIKSLDTNKENMEKEMSVKGVKSVNDKAINDFKEAQIKTKDEKTQNSETSDDSSDNTTLQMLKEKISTVAESSITSISITKNEESSLSSVTELQQQNNTTVTVAANKKPEAINLSAAENDEINKKEVPSSSTGNIEKSINQNQDDLSSKSSNDATTNKGLIIEMIEEKDMEEKTNKESFIIKQEKEDISKVGNENIETNTENCSSSVEDEQKKYLSESSIIVIQEDDDESNNATERNVSATALSNEQRSATNSNQNENENLQKMNTTMKVSVVDLQRIDDELLGVENEKQILKSMDDERRAFKKNVEQNSKTVIDHTTKKDQNECKTTDKGDVVINERKSNSVAAVATIVIDTDEELSMEVVKDDQIPRMKRDYSRKKLDTSVGVNTNATTAATDNSSTIVSASPVAIATTTTNAATVTASTSATALVTEKKFEERTTTTSDDNTSTIVSSSSSSNRQNLSIKRLKEREGSESPLVVVNDDETTTDSIPRTRRRYSSTPIFDSIPNSPASSDDKEYKAWKKSIIMIYNRLTIHKNASIFLRPVTEDLAPNYKQIVHKPMDLQTIKRNIETGVIRTTTEFQRDVMLMCQNAIMYNQTNNNVYNMAKEMWADSVNVIETLLESIKKDATTADHHRTSSAALSSSNVNTGTTTANTVKSRGRKSNRLP